MDLTRRSFLAGLGSVTVGLLFARKLDAVLESLERDLVAEQQAEGQPPSAAEIVVLPVAAFRPERLVVAASIAPLFVIEDIRIGTASQFASNQAVSAEMFVPDARNMEMPLAVAAGGTEIRFRVRYVGNDPRGARFQAALIGRSLDSAGLRALPVDSRVAIVG